MVERNVAYYNLDVIISVGYRVKSHRGMQFRMWATKVLREYLIKGFALNDELLKRAGGGNYFDELLARIRDIRSSEKVFYRKVLEIYALSIDYDPLFAIQQLRAQLMSAPPPPQHLHKPHAAGFIAPAGSPRHLTSCRTSRPQRGSAKHSGIPATRENGSWARCRG